MAGRRFAKPASLRECEWHAFRGGRTYGNASHSLPASGRPHITNTIIVTDEPSACRRQRVRDLDCGVRLAQVWYRRGEFPLTRRDSSTRSWRESPNPTVSTPNGPHYDRNLRSKTSFFTKASSQPENYRSMKISVHLLPELTSPDELADDTVVVIDILRSYDHDQLRVGRRSDKGDPMPGRR